LPELAACHQKTIRRDINVISRTFDNADFGYTRITIERPLRLRFRMESERMNQFLEGAPSLLDDLTAIVEKLDYLESRDWNRTWADIQRILRQRESRWRAPEQKLFRNVFTDRSPEAEAVVLSRESYTGPVGSGPLPGQTKVGSIDPSEDDRCFGFFPDPTGNNGYIVRFEADAALRDFENVPLNQSTLDYFRSEVLPHLPDAWMNPEKQSVGYEINFNRYFFRYSPPRPLVDIDEDLKAAEAEFLRLLGEATK
jgi:type I restriction enzyme M protein